MKAETRTAWRKLFALLLVFLGTVEVISPAVAATVTAWGSNGAGQTNIPPGLSNVVAIAAGDYHSLAIKSDGTVAAWGLDTYGATDVPADLTNAVAIGGGLWHTLALRSDGTLRACGQTSYGLSTVPDGLSNVIAIACGTAHNVVLRNDGTVTAWGDPSFGSTNVPPGLSNVIAVAAGDYMGLALRADGTLVAWGNDFSGMAEVPAGLTNVQAISCGSYHSLALKRDGTVTSWGYNAYGQTNVPANLGNLIAVAAGGWNTGIGHSLALKRDGAVVGWGYNDYGQATAPVGISNFVAITAGSTHSLGLLDGPHPFISRQPVGQTVYSGVDVVLRSAAIGAGPLGFQWCVNGTNISGASNNALVLTNAQPQVSGNYTVVVTNTFGAVTSFIAPIAVTASLPLVTLLTSSNVALTAGGSTTFVATVTGSLPLTRQWLHNGNPIPGAIQNSLTISNAAPSDNGPYTFVATNQYGQASTSVSLNVFDLPAALNATNFTWTTSGSSPWYPQLSATHDGIAAAESASVGSGDNSVLQTTVTGPGTLTFYWNFWSGGSGDALLFSINGTTASRITQLTDWQQQTYYLGTGPQTLQWTRVKYSPQYVYNAAWVDEVGYTPGPTPPLIASPPTGATVLAGRTATFSVGAQGTPPLGYQWQFNGNPIAGATNATFQLTNAQASNIGGYTVVVSNGYGATNASASLNVTPSGPFMVTAPASLVLPANATARFSVTAIGSEPFTYQWLFNTNNIISGATSSVLTLANIHAPNAGTYQVIVSNAYGSFTSERATLTVVSPSMVVGWGYGAQGQTTFPLSLTNAVAIAAGYYHSLVLRSNGTVLAFGAGTANTGSFPNYGQSQVPANLSNVVAIAAGPYHSLALKADGTLIGWGYNLYGQASSPPGLSNVVALAAGGNHSLALGSDGTVFGWGRGSEGQTTPPVQATNIIAVAAGANHCLALNDAGAVFAWGDNSFGQTNIPGGLSNAVAVACGYGNSLALRADGTVVAWGHDSSHESDVPSGLSNVVAISAGSQHSMALKADGSVAVWGSTANGMISVAASLSQVVSIAAGGLHSVAILNDGSPFIFAQPMSRSLYTGANTRLRIAAMGAPLLTYQWQFNGTDIAGATDTQLILTNIALSASGTYKCAVQNPLGSLLSLPANLTVWRSMPVFETGAPGSGLSSSGFTLRLNGLSGHGNITLFASTNLSAWVPVLTNPPVIGTLMLLDPAATSFPARFYKVLEQ